MTAALRSSASAPTASTGGAAADDDGGEVLGPAPGGEGFQVGHQAVPHDDRFSTGVQQQVVVSQVRAIIDHQLSGLSIDGSHGAAVKPRTVAADEVAHWVTTRHQTMGTACADRDPGSFDQHNVVRMLSVRSTTVRGLRLVVTTAAASKLLGAVW